MIIIYVQTCIFFLDYYLCNQSPVDLIIIINTKCTLKKVFKRYNLLKVLSIRLVLQLVVYFDCIRFFFKQCLVLKLVH